jgi:hypothetical protein
MKFIRDPRWVVLPLSVALLIFLGFEVYDAKDRSQCLERPWLDTRSPC